METLTGNQTHMTPLRKSTCEEVKYGHVNDVEQSVSRVVGVELPYRVTVERINLPSAKSTLL